MHRTYVSHPTIYVYLPHNFISYLYYTLLSNFYVHHSSHFLSLSFLLSLCLALPLSSFVVSLFLSLDGLFSKKITIFTTNQCEKLPSSIRCWYSNPQPSERESPPITTRPGLPFYFYFSLSLFNSSISLFENNSLDSVSHFSHSLSSYPFVPLASFHLLLCDLIG